MRSIGALLVPWPKIQQQDSLDARLFFNITTHSVRLQRRITGSCA
jgi:hypothetical protein